MNQIRRDKDKRVQVQISSIDEAYSNKIEQALNENWNEQTHLNALKCLAENLLGGKRDKEWILKGKLDIE